NRADPRASRTEELEEARFLIQAISPLADANQPLQRHLDAFREANHSVLLPGVTLTDADLVALRRAAQPVLDETVAQLEALGQKFGPSRGWIAIRGAVASLQSTRLGMRGDRADGLLRKPTRDALAVVARRAQTDRQDEEGRRLIGEI